MKEFRRLGLPITPQRKIMRQNRYTIGQTGLALIIAELQKYEISLLNCKKLLDRIDIQVFDEQVDAPKNGKTKKLIVMIPSRDYLDRAGSSTAATSWEEVTEFAKDEANNFIPTEIG